VALAGNKARTIFYEKKDSGSCTSTEGVWFNCSNIYVAVNCDARKSKYLLNVRLVDGVKWDFYEHNGNRSVTF